MGKVGDQTVDYVAKCYRVDCRENTGQMAEEGR